MHAKKWCSLLLLFGTLLLPAVVQCQATPSAQKVAPFEITLSNGKKYSASELKKEPLVLVYFSPDCEHCKQFTIDLLKHYHAVSNKQVVLITYYPLEHVKAFDRTYSLSGYPNIKTGTEGFDMKVRKYYNVEHFPYVVLYDASGKQVRKFDTERPFAEILQALLKL